MSEVSYQGIQMELVRTRRMEREAEYSDDRTTYLRTRWLIEVDTVYNPGATASVFSSNGAVRGRFFAPRSFGSLRSSSLLVPVVSILKTIFILVPGSQLAT